MEYVYAKKKFGQNFLKNTHIIEKIANSIKTLEHDLIIEIGPGMGALTKELKKKNTYLVCYEIDERMKEYLDPLLDKKTKVIYGDFLKANVLDDIKDIPYQNCYVIANIPYYITSPILQKLTTLKFCQKITLLVQKEVAKRIVRDNNTLSLFLDFYYTSTILLEVGKNNFVPAPKVDSAVLSLVRKENILESYEEGYQKFIREAFSKRRKTLKNNLRSYNWVIIASILNKLGYSDMIRAEDIKREDFLKIVVALEEN